MTHPGFLLARLLSVLMIVSAQSFNVTFQRLANEAEVTIKRPQEPKQPYPYSEEEVVFQNKTDAVQLAGTLTLPKSGGPFPAVIFITGSGPQDRDETLFGHRPFLVLADHLTKMQRRFVEPFQLV
jgi:hypothetical protein